jgi:hypothetical protein
MLSTTVEPECRRRPFDIWSPNTVDKTPEREATNALAHATIHPADDHFEAYGNTAPANSAAVH